MKDTDYSEALYNEKRNAIPSWQGYEYQGEVALSTFLKIISEVFANNTLEEAERECQRIELKIEWLEDFIILKNGEISDIYQVKKTLYKSGKDEVIANFIMQYKFLNDNNIKWHIIYSELDGAELADKPSELEFDDIYQKNIEGIYVKDIQKLMNKRDIGFWKQELNLKNTTSINNKCKAYVRKLLEVLGVDFKNNFSESL